MEMPVTAQNSGQLERYGEGGNCGESFSTTLDMGGLFVLAESDGVFVLDAGVTANLVCFRYLENRDRILQRKGFPRVSRYPASARFKFGDGRQGEVLHAADIPAGIVDNRGK